MKPSEAHEPRRSLRDSPQRFWLLALLFGAMVSCYAQRFAISIAAPFMMKQLGFSAASMGLVLSAFFWMYSLLQIPGGTAVDRFGVRRVYAAGYTLWSIASALTGFTSTLFQLVIARVLLGVGQAVSFPASGRAVANWFKQEERGGASAVYLVGVRLGQAAAAVLGVWLFSSRGFRLYFLIIGLVPIVWVVPWLAFLGKWERPEDRAAARSVAAGSTARAIVEGFLLLRQRTVLGIFLGFFAYDYAWFVYLTWLPGYLKLERNFTTREMAIYTATPLIAMSVIIFFSGVLSDWLVRQNFREVPVRKCLIVIGLAIACLIVPAGLVQNKMTAVWLLTISLCGLGVATASTWTLTQAICSPKLVGTVSGIQNFGGNLGGVIAPALTGYIADVTHSFALALSLTGGILVLGIISYTFLISCPVQSQN